MNKAAKVWKCGFIMYFVLAVSNWLAQCVGAVEEPDSLVQFQWKFLIVLPGINVIGGLVGHTIHRSIDCGGGEFDIADAQVSCVPKIDRLEDILEIEIRFTFQDGC